MSIICKWLPDIIRLEDYNGNWLLYEEALYQVFYHDFVASKPLFNNLYVNIRKYPIVNGKEQAFFHITSVEFKDINDRIPDLRRCERIRWPRKIIENYMCQYNCKDCNKIKVWAKPYKNTYRIHILFQDVKFLVVIEERKNYYLLITCFYIEHGHTLDKKLKEYEKYKM